MENSQSSSRKVANAADTAQFAARKPRVAADLAAAFDHNF
jgi:hypothetical protein